MTLKARYVILSLVFLVSGFLITFSFQHTKSNSRVVQLSDSDWEKDYYYRQQLIDLEAKNKDLRNELREKRHEIQEIEEMLGEEEEVVGEYVEIKKNLQLLTGELPIKGEGFKITLRDADYIPSEENVNQYIVHDRHIHLVVNELFSAGAEAISINGQRIFKDSYISCTGPVITVDGNQYPAPFTISAIGDPEVLDTSLNLTNGVVDMLLNDNIEVETEKMNTILMDPRITSER